MGSRRRPMQGHDLHAGGPDAAHPADPGRLSERSDAGVPGQLANTGFGLGVFGLVAGFMPIFGFLVTVPALLLSRAGLRRFREGRAGEPGFGRAGVVLGWIGIGIGALMTVMLFVSMSQAPAQQSVTAPPPVVAPALIAVPNVVGMSDVQARDALRAAGFTNVVLGPSTGPQPGVAAGTVTTQLPGAAALAAAGDPITLGEASEPPAPAPVVAPQAAPTTEPAPQTQAARPFVAAPDTDVDRPYVPPAPQRAASGGSSSGGGSSYYANCDAARAAGAAPIMAGEPGYRAGLDRNKDGVACE